MKLKPRYPGLPIISSFKVPHDSVRESLHLQYADLVSNPISGELSTISYRGRGYHLWVRKKHKREAQGIAKRMRRYGFGVYIHEFMSGPYREYHVFVRLKK